MPLFFSSFSDFSLTVSDLSDWDSATIVTGSFIILLDSLRGKNIVKSFSSNDILSNPAPVNIFDFSAGLLGYTDNFYFGIASHHLTEPEISLNRGTSNDKSILENASDFLQNLNKTTVS